MGRGAQNISQSAQILYGEPHSRTTAKSTVANKQSKEMWAKRVGPYNRLAYHILTDECFIDIDAVIQALDEIAEPRAAGSTFKRFELLLNRILGADEQVREYNQLFSISFDHEDVTTVLREARRNYFPGIRRVGETLLAFPEEADKQVKLDRLMAVLQNHGDEN